MVRLRDGEAPAFQKFGSVGIVPAQQQKGRAEVRKRERKPFAEQVAVQFADGYEAALTSLDYCARSAQEIAASLRRKGYVEPCVEAVVARLTENRLIDDASYDERMAESQASKPVVATVDSF